MKLSSQKFITKCVRKIHTAYYITTPIFYVNASPHIGHLYSAVIADAAYLFHRLKFPNDKTVFSTGTDEHGLKVQQAAAAANFSDVKYYCDKISSSYKNLFDLCNIQYTRFIRTTDEDHVKSVQSFWNLLESKGFIYSGKYSGWYCVPDETFLSEYQLLNTVDENGNEIKISGVSGHKVEWSEEENYMFKLGSLKSDLLHWMKDESRVIPSQSYKILDTWIREEDGVTDISISRPCSRNPWGIPVPSCPTQNIYVWLDALVNYLTAVGYPDLTAWPPNIQIIGKDILKFHGIYWPAFLIAAGLEPPRQLFVHSHWTVDDVKMSKSKNNVVDPFEKISLYKASGLRYFLLKEGVPHSDGNYSEEYLVNMLNADLANNLGNLLTRCTSKTVNAKQMFPSFNKSEFDKLYVEKDTLKALSTQVSCLRKEVDEYYETLYFCNGIHAVLHTLTSCNKFVDDCKPWELCKREVDTPKLMCVLHICLETLRVCSIALLPIVPEISVLVFRKLGIPPSKTIWKSMKPPWDDDVDTINENVPLSSERIILYNKLLKK